jgi:hypothetical protein
MKYLVILLIGMLLLMNLPLTSYSESGYSMYDSLKLRHTTNPNICLFEVDPSLYDDWDSLRNITIIAINEWIIKLEYVYPDGNWGVDIKIIPWEDHENKLVENYNECNIMINYDKTSDNTSLGYTSLNFNKSWHKFMFINVFLESQKSVTEIIIGDNNTSIKQGSVSYPLPKNTIKNIVLHEFGHGLGLGHFESSRPPNMGMMSYTKSAMIPSINPFDENQNLYVTYLDLTMIAKIYGENGWGSPQPVYHIDGCNILNTFVFRCF